MITARIDLEGSGVTPLRWQHVADGVLERVRAIPGVEAAGAATMAPLGDATHMVGFRLSGDRPEPIIASALGYVVTPGYAEALHLRVRQGRFLQKEDTVSATQAMVVNERFVSRYLHDGRPVLGRRYPGLLSPNTTAEIVGVVDDVLKNGFLDRPQPEFYVAVGNQGGVAIAREVNLIVRADADPRSLIGNLRSVVHDIDPDAPIHNIAPLATEVLATAGESRFASTMFTAFATFALSLAAIGLYGSLSYAVHRRRRELGVRAALGATRRSLMALVLREGVGLTALGLVLGVAVAAASARFMGAALFEISVLDAVSFAVGPLILIAVALAACALPAWRAGSLDPIRALRSE